MVDSIQLTLDDNETVSNYKYRVEKKTDDEYLTVDVIPDMHTPSKRAACINTLEWFEVHGSPKGIRIAKEALKRTDWHHTELFLLHLKNNRQRDFNYLQEEIIPDLQKTEFYEENLKIVNCIKNNGSPNGIKLAREILSKEKKDSVRESAKDPVRESAVDKKLIECLITRFEKSQPAQSEIPINTKKEKETEKAKPKASSKEVKAATTQIEIPKPRVETAAEILARETAENEAKDKAAAKANADRDEKAQKDKEEKARFEYIAMLAKLRKENSTHAKVIAEIIANKQKNAPRLEAERLKEEKLSAERDAKREADKLKARLAEVKELRYKKYLAD